MLTWPAGTATGIGSLPGTDPLDAALLVTGELPDLPHLVELPARGPGAEMVGRAGAILVDLPIELTPSSWRLVARPGRDLSRARDLLAQDLDALEVAGQGHAGALKLQCAGPWTLAGALETPRGHRVVADRAARADLVASLAEGVRALVADVHRRLPRAGLLLQLDEPSLGIVAAGRLPTPSGFGAVPAVEVAELVAGLTDVAEAVGVPTGVHSCADDPRLDVVRQMRPAFVAVDVGRLDTRRDYDHLAGCVDDGAAVLCGVLPSTDAELRAPVRETATRVSALARDLGLPEGDVASRVAVTPACGLAGASPAYARAVMARAREVARSVAEGAGA